MCGIAGVISTARSDAYKFCTDTCNKLEHRGPDDSGWMVSESETFFVGLAQTRLSIIDLSQGGHQPFTLPSGLTFTYNGEIYNYLEIREELSSLGVVFATDSDTEVLARAWEKWGEECLGKLDGMFAFGVFDPASNRLTLVRDAFGIKPLYFSLRDNIFYFSSTPDSIADAQSVHDEIDLQAAFTYLAYGQYDMGERTFFSHVKRLQSGHLMHVYLDGNLLNTSLYKWWRPQLRTRALDFDSAAEDVRTGFLESVRIQMRSDVPIGFALSGGVDSSAIACSARFMFPAAQLKAFGYMADDEKVTEEKWIRIAAQHTSAELVEVRFPDSQLEKDFHDMALMQGEPFSSSRIYAQFKVFESASRAGVKVVLEGQGGDELFAGYHGFAHLRVISLLERADFLGLIRFVLEWRKWPGRAVSALAAQSFSYLVHLNRWPARIQLLARKLVSGDDALKFVKLRIARKLGLDLRTAHQHRLSRAFRGRRVTEGLLDALTASYIPQLVRQGDRNAMAHSVENRVPFLSVPLVEKVLALPEEYLISPKGETKSVLKKAMRGVVPDPLLDRKDKVGFETPQDRLSKSDILRAAALSVYRDNSGVFPFVKYVDPDQITSVSLRWRYLNLAFWADQRLKSRGD